MEKKKIIYSTKWITITAMLTALVVATSFIPPAPTAFGNVYWCDGIIFLAAYLVNPISAFIIGGLGTFLYDLVFGNAVMAIPSLIIHGLQAVVTSFLLNFLMKRNTKIKETVMAIICSVPSALIVIAGYFLLRFLIQEKGFEYAILRMGANVIQEIVGIVFAILICYVSKLKVQLVKNKLLPYDYLSKSQDENKTTN